MKCIIAYGIKENTGSPPARGAWIEIAMGVGKETNKKKSPPARGAWIEILTPQFCPW